MLIMESGLPFPACQEPETDSVSRPSPLSSVSLAQPEFFVDNTVVFAGKVTFTFYFKSKQKVQYFLLE